MMIIKRLILIMADEVFHNNGNPGLWVQHKVDQFKISVVHVPVVNQGKRSNYTLKLAE